MKAWKPLTLAAVTATVICLVGAASASGTVLCHTNTSPCSSIVGVGTKIESALVPGTFSVIKAGFATIECESSELDSQISNAGSASSTPTATVIVFNKTQCGKCTVAVLKKGGLIWHHTSGGNTTITSTAAEVTVACSGTSCVYGTTGTETDVGTKTGGSPARFTINASLPKVSGGFLCANPASWTAMYNVSTPNPLYGASS